MALRRCEMWSVRYEVWGAVLRWECLKGPFFLLILLLLITFSNESLFELLRVVPRCIVCEDLSCTRLFIREE